MKEKFLKDLGLDENIETYERLSKDFNLEELFEKINEEKKEEEKND